MDGVIKNLQKRIILFNTLNFDGNCQLFGDFLFLYRILIKNVHFDYSNIV